MTGMGLAGMLAEQRVGVLLLVKSKLTAKACTRIGGAMCASNHRAINLECQSRCTMQLPSLAGCILLPA
jgi:hypothetical protein